MISAGIHTRIAYLGDLAPVGLTAYLSMVARWKGRRGAPAFVGVNDDVLGLAERQPKLTLTRSGVPLTTVEREYVRFLDSLKVDWDALVGPRSMEILRKGTSVPMEFTLPQDTGAPGAKSYMRRYLDLVLPRGGE